MGAEPLRGGGEESRGGPATPCPDPGTPTAPSERGDKLGVLGWSHHGGGRLRGSWAGWGALKGRSPLLGLRGPGQPGGCRQNPWVGERLLLTPPRRVPPQVAPLDAAARPEEEGG